MKIAYISNLVEPTGGDRILYYHMNILRDKGHVVDPYFTGWIESYQDHDDGWNKPDSGIISYNPHDLSKMDFSDYDMVIANGLMGAQNVMTINHNNKVWFCQNFDPYIFGDREDVHNTYSYFHKYLVYSNDLKKIINHYYGIKKIIVCTNGIEYSKFAPYQNVDSKGSKRICFMVAYYRNYKGIRFANEIFGKLKERGYITVEINATAGPLDNTMEFFRNPSFERKSEIVASCDVSIHPSVFETWNLTSMESMALGTPVVGVNSKGIMEYANDSNAVIFNDRNSDKICDAIDFLYNNYDKYYDLQMNGIRTAANYDWNNISDNIELSYKELL